MINIALSLLAATLTTLAFGFLFGGGSFRLGYGIIPGMIAFPVAFFFLARRVQRELQAIMHRVQEVITPKNPRAAQQREVVRRNIDEAVRILQDGMKWRWWQVFTASQLAGQIGRLYYLDQRFDDAEPWLQQAFVRDWGAKAMLAALRYRRKDIDGMKAAFEIAVKSGKKESIVWNMYAWCLVGAGDRDAAIDVLNRARKAVPGDDRTRRNLENLQNGRGVKMKGWDMMWYQFHLEKPPAQAPPRARQRGDRRQMFRGR
ncbi:MAG: tetratricopeptide repeat protein [Deltaproteobacteria bacterium]|nr:MAG: tetratricopeptide repeat protein [Deltaproteobacteria bacterium]